jgi:hypothetical protein
MSHDQVLRQVVGTLISAGFRIVNTHRKPYYAALTVGRRDDFDVENRYIIACCEPDYVLTEGDVRSLERQADSERASPIAIGKAISASESVRILNLDEFFGRLGGAVSALLPLESEYPERLRLLGHNRLPVGLVGRPDDLFEEYVHAGLEFVLHDRVVRYGQERRGEPVPDGFVSGRRSLLMLYDAKAANDGYQVTRDTIRQFADYVRKFHEQYEPYTGRLYCFVAISGHFASEDTLEERSAQLYEDCSVPLRFLTADEMSGIVRIFAERPSYRQAIAWKQVFAKVLITSETVERNLHARERDAVIRR